MYAQAWYNLTNHKRLEVTNKSYVPPSGDKHDYVSNGPYWFPREKAPCVNDPAGIAATQAHAEVGLYTYRCLFVKTMAPICTHMHHHSALWYRCQMIAMG